VPAQDVNESTPELTRLRGLRLLPLSIWWGSLVWLTVGKTTADVAYRWPQSLERLIEPAILIVGLLPLMGLFGSNLWGISTQKRIRFFLVLTAFMVLDLFVWLSRISVPTVWVIVTSILLLVVSLSAVVIMQRS